MERLNALVTFVCALHVGLAPLFSEGGIYPLSLQCVPGHESPSAPAPADGPSGGREQGTDEDSDRGGFEPVPCSPLIAERGPLGADLVKPALRSAKRALLRAHKDDAPRETSRSFASQADRASLPLADVAPLIQSHAPPRR